MKLRFIKITEKILKVTRGKSHTTYKRTKMGSGNSSLKCIYIIIIGKKFQRYYWKYWSPPVVGFLNIVCFFIYIGYLFHIILYPDALLKFPSVYIVIQLILLCFPYIQLYHLEITILNLLFSNVYSFEFLVLLNCVDQNFWNNVK